MFKKSRLWLQTFSIVFIITFVFWPLMTNPAMALPGTDGNRTYNTAGNIIINRYSQIVAVNQGGNTITVNNINDLADGQGHYANNALGPGDMLLIYQAQGATFTNTDPNSPTWGAFNVGNAGTYQFAVVSSIAGNVITVESGNSVPYQANGILRNYANAQAVRVPQYSNLTIGNGVTVTSAPWNGTIGGIVALVVQGTLTVNGAINVSSQGFRGGVIENNSAIWPTTITTYASLDSNNGAEKGESILGFQTVYDANGGRYGRGAPANGGGGGDAHNSGGGGGANGSNGGTWNGSGTPDTSNASWAPAWDLDDLVDDGVSNPLPTYFVGGAGGGRGGYSFSYNADTVTPDPLTQGPGNTIWYGDNRRQVGGLGGRPLNNNASVSVFLGGGGGAGDGNNSSSTSGANGGGLIVLTAGTITGSGQVLANGANADTTINTRDDAPGGGGGGGSIIVQTASINGTSLSFQANGGNGGNQNIAVYDPGRVEAEGPGGGGGGGYIAIQAATVSGASTSVTGGRNGTTTSAALTAFVPNGATQGYAGSYSTSPFTFPGSGTPTAIQLLRFDTTSSQPGSQPGWLFIGLVLIVLAAGALTTWRFAQAHR